MGSSLTDTIRELAERLHPGKIVLGQTTSEVDASSILDTDNLQNSDADTGVYDGVVVRIDGWVTGGPNVGEAQRVTVGGYAGATADLTTDAFSASVNALTDFSIHRGLRPAEKEKIINRLLSECHHKAFHPISMLTNYDWETATAGVIGGWTFSGAADFDQYTTAANMGYGRYAALCDNDGANDYATCDTDVPCNEGEQWIAHAQVALSEGTATLIAYDVTNSAEIDTAASTQLGLTDLFFNFTIPSGCKLINVRLKGSEAAGDYWWGPVQLLPLAQLQTKLPSWLTNMNQLRRAVVMPLGVSSGGSGDDNAYRAFETEPVPVNYRPLFVPLHANPGRIIVEPSQRGPVFVDCWRPFAELTNPTGAADADETEMDHDTLIAGALAASHEAMAERLSNVDIGRARFHKGQAGKEWRRYADLRRKNGYALPESQVVRPRRRLVRLQ